MLCSIALPPIVLEESVETSALQRFILDGLTSDENKVFNDLEKDFLKQNCSLQMISKVIMTIIEMANIRSLFYDYFSSLLIKIYMKYSNQYENSKIPDKKEDEDDEIFQEKVIKINNEKRIFFKSHGNFNRNCY